MSPCGNLLPITYYMRLLSSPLSSPLLSFPFLSGFLVVTVFRSFSYFVHTTAMLIFTSLAFVFRFLGTSIALPLDLPLPRLVALEEHFTTTSIGAPNAPLWIRPKLEDLDGLRLQEMNEGRVAKQ